MLKKRMILGKEYDVDPMQAVQIDAKVGTQAAFFVVESGTHISTHALFDVPFRRCKVEGSREDLGVHPDDVPPGFVGILALECTHKDDSFTYIPLWKVVKDEL